MLLVGVSDYAQKYLYVDCYTGVATKKTEQLGNCRLSNHLPYQKSFGNTIFILKSLLFTKTLTSDIKSYLLF